MPSLGPCQTHIVKDLAGNAITATAVGRDAYDVALTNLLSFRLSVGDDA